MSWIVVSNTYDFKDRLLRSYELLADLTKRTNRINHSSPRQP